MFYNTAMFFLLLLVFVIVMRLFARFNWTLTVIGHLFYITEWILYMYVDCCEFVCCCSLYLAMSFDIFIDDLHFFRCSHS